MHDFKFSRELILIITYANLKGIHLRLVGGALRDLIEGNQPKDFDLTMDTPPQNFIKIFKKFFKVIPTGIKFGTVSIILNCLHYEITTLRSENNYDGRFPNQVLFLKDPLKDSSRRDFTFNAMYYDFKIKKIIDPFNGYDDLLNKKVKFVKNFNDRIKEDKLRLLRYLRFKIKYFKGGWSWGKRNLNRFSLKSLSSERIYQEYWKILSSKNLKVKHLYNIPKNLFPLEISPKGLKLIESIEPQLKFLPDKLRFVTRMIVISLGNFKNFIKPILSHMKWFLKRNNTKWSCEWKSYFFNKQDSYKAFIESLYINLDNKNILYLKSFRRSLIYFYDNSLFNFQPEVQNWTPKMYKTFNLYIKRLTLPITKNDLNKKTRIFENRLNRR